MDKRVQEKTAPEVQAQERRLWNDSPPDWFKWAALAISILALIVSIAAK